MSVNNGKISFVVLGFFLIFFTACSSQNGVNIENIDYFGDEDYLEDNEDEKNAENIVELKTIDIEEFKIKLSEKPNSILLDIRTLSEFNSGHLENAENIDFYSSEFKNSLNLLDKEKTYFIYCRSGSRSSKTLSLMKELGFKNVYNMDGGIISWSNNGFEIVK
ncbi:MAG: rhodanese-like domain-containing protein [Nanoarchaeota archaeon]|nr:rhodanese-like domain-containing protein [Nanoarchaeota archaeon]